MTYIEPDTPGGPSEIQPPQAPQPDIDPSAIPDEAPPTNPPGGGDGDSRPHDAE
jgi:hypothetical protein